MPRVAHGSSVSPEQLQQANEALADRAAEVVFGFAAATTPALQDFDFLFPDLQDNPANLLPRSATTVKRLKDLGQAMVDPGPATGDGKVPAIYTYLGQFVDHDITFERSSLSTSKLVDPALVPLPLERIRNELKNTRTASLELDSVYDAPAQRDPANQAKMRIGKVTKLNGTEVPFKRPPGKGDDNDLFREGPSSDKNHDRAAILGDPRNDENLIISQLHLAFLKAHNRLVDQGRSFEEARRILRHHYQHVVLHDFLKRIADPAIVDDVITGGNRFYHATDDPFFLPLEFAVAGFRFGHTMIRETYDYNLNFPEATLDQLFTFTAFSGQLGGDSKTLPDNWIIQWERFIAPDGGKNKARKFDTKLSDGLFKLKQVDGTLERPGEAAKLAIRNLLRGYALRMPTGQALANALDVSVLTPAQLQAAAASETQARLLKDFGFLERTPLWYYLLAEARHHGGLRLGPAGSTLVAEVLVGLVRRTDNSILATPGWVPSLPSATPGRFELADLLRFAKVVGGGAAPKTYKVKSGDSLSSIAMAKLGNAKRWPELFVLNRAKIRHRDRIDPGLVLTLPGPTPIKPTPQLYKVKSGDSLSSIAKAKLGNADRWPEIHKLNRDVVPNPNAISPGLELVIVKT